MIAAPAQERIRCRHDALQARHHADQIVAKLGIEHHFLGVSSAVGKRHQGAAEARVGVAGALQWLDFFNGEETGKANITVFAILRDFVLA